MHAEQTSHNMLTPRSRHVLNTAHTRIAQQALNTSAVHTAWCGSQISKHRTSYPSYPQCIRSLFSPPPSSEGHAFKYKVSVKRLFDRTPEPTAAVQAVPHKQDKHVACIQCTIQMSGPTEKRQTRWTHIVILSAPGPMRTLGIENALSNEWNTTLIHTPSDS